MAPRLQYRGQVDPVSPKVSLAASRNDDEKRLIWIEALHFHKKSSPKTWLPSQPGFDINYQQREDGADLAAKARISPKQKLNPSN